MFNTVYGFRSTDTVCTVFVGVVAKAFKTADIRPCKFVTAVNRRVADVAN